MPPLHVLFLGLNLDRRSGVAKSQITLARALQDQGVCVDQLTTDDGNSFEYRTCEGKQVFSSLDDFAQAQDAFYDVIHVQSPIWSPGRIDGALPFIQKMYAAPTIYTFRSELEDTLQKRLLVNCCDMVTFLTQTEREKYLASKFTQKPSAVVPNTVEPMRVTPHLSRDQFAAPDEVLLLYVGRFSPEKGIFDLCESFSEIAEDHNAKLVLIGSEGASVRGVEQEIDHLLRNVCDRVIRPGWITRQDVAQYHNICDLQIIPSHKEAFGRAGVEAVLNGCPVAVSSIPTLREVYQLDTIPLAKTFDSLTAQTLAQLCDDIRSDPVELFDISRYAAKVFLDRYSPKTVSQQFLAVYESLFLDAAQAL